MISHPPRGGLPTAHPSAPPGPGLARSRMRPQMRAPLPKQGAQAATRPSPRAARRNDVRAAAINPATAAPPPLRSPSHVVALGNICVDVLVPFPDIPPTNQVKTPAMLARLAAAAPRPADQAGDPASDAALELGGNANFLIAAARLGLETSAAAYVGDDDYGAFATRELGREGVRLVGPLVEWKAAARPAPPGGTGEGGRRPLRAGETLVCYVLVDEHAPGGPRHAFCSRYDLGPHPLHAPAAAAGGGGGPAPSIAPGAAAALATAGAAFVNGFAFDELPAGVVLDALAALRRPGGGGRPGGLVLFDPGPRAPALAAAGTLGSALSAADVLLLTEEEAAAVTGRQAPEDAARALLADHGAGGGGAVTTVLIKRGPAGALLVRAGEPGAVHARPAPSITARDTVGCGDSFAAAVALALSVGAPPGVTLALANAVGAATALSPGAGRNVATAPDAAALLRRAGGADADAVAALRLLASSLEGAKARRRGGGGGGAAPPARPPPGTAAAAA